MALVVAWSLEEVVASDPADIHTVDAHTLGPANCLQYEEDRACSSASCYSPSCMEHCTHCRRSLAEAEGRALCVTFVVLRCEGQHKSRSVLAKENESPVASVWLGRRKATGSPALEAQGLVA